MKLYSVAVVGAGAVGEQLLRSLFERRFPVKDIKVLARSQRLLVVDGRQYEVRTTTAEAFDDVDIALFAGTEGEKGAAVTFGPEAVRRGAIVIDNGADFRMRRDVPLVVPEVNGSALDSHAGIISNPNCSTAQLVMALKPIHDAVKVTRVMVATYQAVSGAGGSAVSELKRQNREIAAGNSCPAVGTTFPVQIAGNVIPQIGGFDEEGYTSEEMKLVHETRKIMSLPNLCVTPMVAARVPVITGHSEAVYIETDQPITVRDAEALWRAFPGVELIDDIANERPTAQYPTPLFAEGKDATFIGRIRRDVCNPCGLNFWVVSDNLRKGAASNAVQIAQALVDRQLVCGK